jgi:hypothetical protein
MSNVFDAVAWAIKVSRGEPMQARMLLIVGLAQRINESGDFVVWPSIGQICEDTDMSRTSVKKWMRYLEDKQFVERFERLRDNKTNSSNGYRLAVKAVFYHPTKGAIEDEDSRGRNPTGRGRHPTGEGSVDATGRGRTGRPPVEQSEEHTLEDSELPLGLEPLPPKEVTPLDLAAFIASEWVTRAHATPLRGGRPSEANIEKAMKLARDEAIEGQTPIDVWRDIFKEIDLSDFLQGKVAGKDGRPPFKLTLSFLLEKRNFVKTLEGRFGGQSTGERRLGSTSTATGNFLNRLRSGPSRSAGGGGSQRAISGR